MTSGTWRDPPLESSEGHLVEAKAVVAVVEAVAVQLGPLRLPLLLQFRVSSLIRMP